MADENPYCSPQTSSPPEFEVPKASGDSKRKRSSGCAALFLLALPLVDLAAMYMPRMGARGPVLLAVALGGFLCGGIAGTYVPIRAKRCPRWLFRNWVFHGFLGMGLATGTFLLGVRLGWW